VTCSFVGAAMGVTGSTGREWHQSLHEWLHGVGMAASPRVNIRCRSVSDLHARRSTWSPWSRRRCASGSARPRSTPANGPARLLRSRRRSSGSSVRWPSCAEPPIHVPVREMPPARGLPGPRALYPRALPTPARRVPPAPSPAQVVQRRRARHSYHPAASSSLSRREGRLPSADISQPKRHGRPLRIGPRRALGQQRG